MQAAEATEQIRAITQPVRAARSSIGFVPTMGALHEGHLELIHTAKRECDFVVVSIFVNPIQFGPGEDYASYPRPTADDLVKCSSAGVDVVFTPSVDQMYRPDRVTTVHVAGLTETLCGLNRPAHFDGVTTVVAKLFNIVQPDTAYFGQKDAQQAIVVHRMIVDLDFPVKLRICPTVRTPAGLALSSRNEYLTDGQLGQASCLYRALTAARDMIRLGETHTERGHS